MPGRLPEDKHFNCREDYQKINVSIDGRLPEDYCFNNCEDYQKMNIGIIGRRR
jgi:hypothetical protein